MQYIYHNIISFNSQILYFMVGIFENLKLKYDKYKTLLLSKVQILLQLGYSVNYLTQLENSAITFFDIILQL